jgi:hypothetical protein
LGRLSKTKRNQIKPGQNLGHQNKSACAMVQLLRKAKPASKCGSPAGPFVRMTFHAHFPKDRRSPDAAPATHDRCSEAL